MIAAILLLLLVLVAVLVVLGRARPLSSLNLPGPAHHWFWGVVPTLKKNVHRFHDWSLEETLKHGSKNWGQTFPFGKRAIVLGPNVENAEYILKTKFDNYVKNPYAVTVARDLFGHGIFVVDGDRWKVKRKLASHIFSARSLRDFMVEVMIKHSHSVCTILAKAADAKEDVDIEDLYFKYTLTTFSEIGFGEDIDEVNGKSQFGKHFDQAQHNLFARGFDPLWKIRRMFQWGSREKDITSAIAFLSKFTKTSIQARRKDVNRGQMRDLISRWIMKGEEEGLEVTDEYLYDVMMNFLIAGRDTTACAMSWATFMFHKHPEVVDKLLEELAQEAPGETPIDYQVCKKLTYMEACLNETVRLYPPVSTNSKFCKEDDVLPDGTFVPKNTIVSYRPYIFGRSKELWGEDALEFKPERWLQGEAHSQYKFISFNAGRRICLGKAVALLEMKILLGMILQRFKIPLKKNHEEVTYVPDMILKMKNKLMVSVERR